MKYLLGIDIGGTKADYLLCDAEGQYLDYHQGHSPKDRDYNKLIAGMEQQLIPLLERNNISIDEISAACIGVSAVVSPAHLSKVSLMIKESLSPAAIKLTTDTAIATQAYWLDGAVYSFAGTGAIVMGLGRDNKWVTVGALGLRSGDEASGNSIYRKAISLLYDYHYRCGQDSKAFPELESLLNLDPSDIHQSLNTALKSAETKSTDIIKIMDKAAQEGDNLAQSLFTQAGESAAKSAAGCIHRLAIQQNTVQIILIGSIWNKIKYKGMRQAFQQTTEHLSNKQCRLLQPKAPPVVGSIFLAKELTTKKRPNPLFRQKVIDSTAFALKD